MAPRSLIDFLNISPAGGVAGRRGFRFQDHVAASIFLDMMSNPEITQIECETADDLVVRKIVDGVNLNEYIQVKTTEGDHKWSLSELKQRDRANGKLKIGTSLIEKSLSCDRFQDAAQFRFVSTRDIRSEIALFKSDRNNRGPIKAEFDKFAEKFKDIHKAFKSTNGNDIEYWARNMYWQVENSSTALETKNVNRILSLADRDGQSTRHSHAKIVYDRLLNAVGDAADALAEMNPDAKAITRAEAFEWWKKQLEDMRKLHQGNIKVYQVATRGFFTDLHEIIEHGDSRQLNAYDVSFDLEQWRGRELIDYLLNWLPEVMLPARILASHIGQVEARILVKKAVLERERKSHISDMKLLADLMMHAIMRHYLESEPIACRLFSYNSAMASPISAHIVRNASGDELWLSRSHITLATDHESILSTIISEMKQTLSRDYLTEERDIILQLREPQHMRATSLEKVFDEYGKLQDLLKAIRLPLLIAYDSATISPGYAKDYIDRLIDEVTQSYQNLKPQLNPELKDTKVIIFLIPVQDAQSLISQFGAALRRNS